MNEETQPKWPHLENLDRHPFFLRESEWITVTEKIHGFNVRFGRTPEGAFWIGSRNNVVEEEAGLQGFIEWARSQKDEIPLGYTFFGEWAGKGIQKGIDYGDKRFFLFGISRYNKSIYTFLDWPQIVGWVTNLQCDTVPLLYDGPYPSMSIDLETIDGWRTDQSSLAEEEREGICITRHPQAYDKYGHPLIIKFKNPKFAETANARKNKRPPIDLSAVQPFVDEYATMERLDHVLQAVEEANNGADPLDREQIGDVLRTYYEDVRRESGDDWEALGTDTQRLVGKTLNKAIVPMLDELRMKALEATR